MAECIIKRGGSSVPDGLTAVASLVYPGKTYVGSDRENEINTGTMATKAAETMYVTTEPQTLAVASKYVTGDQTIAAVTQSNLSDGNVKSGTTVAVKSGTENLWSVGGIFTNGCTAAATNIYSGKTAGVNGTIVTGTMPLKGATTYYATTSEQTAFAANTYLTGNQTLAALSQTNLAAGNIKSGVTITVNNGSANVWSVAGTFTSGVTAAASNIYTGAIGYSAGAKITGSMGTKAATTHRATASAQTAVAANTYVTGNQTLAALSQTNLSAGNIKSGTTITINNGNANVWNVAGTFTSGATAVASLIYSGKTAYVNGAKITGTMPLQAAQTITPGTANKTVASGRYLTGDQTITGYSTLVASNIATGITIWNVNGNMLRPNSNQTLYNGSSFGGYLKNGVYVNSQYIGNKSYLAGLCGYGDSAYNQRVTGGSIYLSHNDGNYYRRDGEWNTELHSTILSYNSINFSLFSKLRITGYAYARVQKGSGTDCWSYLYISAYSKANSSSGNEAYIHKCLGNASLSDGPNPFSINYDVTYDISTWTGTQSFLGLNIEYELGSSTGKNDGNVKGYYQFTITGIYLSN